MRYFKLPDLGEGLQDAEIVTWHVKPGDTVKVDQLLLSVETAKAIVEIPSPQDGEIARCFGEAGERIHIGEVLVEFAHAEEDSVSVVGDISAAGEGASDDYSLAGDFSVGSAELEDRSPAEPAALPAARALARELQIPLQTLTGSGPEGVITEADVHAYRARPPHGYQALKGPRRAMAQTMSKVHRYIVPVSLFDDADIHRWPAGTDVTIALCRAIGQACKAEPQLNAWYHNDSEAKRLLDHVDIGIAVDTEQGLFVPVLRKVTERSTEDLRQGLNRLREDVKNRSIPLREMQGATITLSNFGTLSRRSQAVGGASKHGRYATPVVVPPQVAIVGAGAIYEGVVVRARKGEVHRLLPLSLTFDHRSITGAEASRFLAVMIDALENMDHNRGG